MYDRFLADPSSVSESWRDFFADFRPAPLPAPMETLAREVAERTGAAGEPSEGAEARAEALGGSVHPEGNGRLGPPAPWDAGQRSAPTPAAAPAAVAEPSGAPAQGGAEPSGVAHTRASPEPAERAVPLRGAALRIAANMSASVGVPTATSF